VAKIAAIIPAQPILKPIKIQTMSIAKDPSQALVLFWYLIFLTMPVTPSPKDKKRAGITPNQKDLSKNQPIKITSPHIKQKFTSLKLSLILTIGKVVSSNGVDKCKRLKLKQIKRVKMVL